MKKTGAKEGGNTAPLVISYLNLRRAIGILGVAFPFILALGSYLIDKMPIQSSISNYYYTGMRDVFVGILFAFALFLFSYKGYNFIDNFVGNLGSIFAIGVAIFPTPPDLPAIQENPTLGTLHFISAALFFSTLIYFSLFLFTKSDVARKFFSPEKINRNIVYILCGCIMIVCILLIASYLLFLEDRYIALSRLYPVFFLESIALLAFGVSWLTKGQTLFKDKTPAKSKSV